MIGEAVRGLVGVARYFTWRENANECFPGTPGAFLRSLAAVVVAFGLAMITVRYEPMQVLTRDADKIRWGARALTFAATYVIELGLAFVAAAVFGRTRFYLRFAAANNWQLLVVHVLLTPVIVALTLAGWMGQLSPVGFFYAIAQFGLVFILFYWSWAILHQALALRWWQSLPTYALMLLIAAFIPDLMKTIAPT